MSSFLVELFGAAASHARIALGFAAFVAVLYFVARPSKGVVITPNQAVAHRRFSWVLIGIVIIFVLFLAVQFTFAAKS